MEWKPTIFFQVVSLLSCLLFFSRLNDNGDGKLFLIHFCFCFVFIFHASLGLNCQKQCSHNPMTLKQLIQYLKDISFSQKFKVCHHLLTHVVPNLSD